MFPTLNVIWGPFRLVSVSVASDNGIWDVWRKVWALWHQNKGCITPEDLLSDKNIYYGLVTQEWSSSPSCWCLHSASIMALGITCSSPSFSCDNIWCAWKLLSNFEWDKAAYLNHCLYYVTDSVTFSKCLPEAPCQTEAPQVPSPQRSPFFATPLLHRLGLSWGGPDPAQQPGCLASPQR